MRSIRCGLVVCILLVCLPPVFGRADGDSAGSSLRAEIAPSDLGVAFVAGSTSQIIIEKNNKRYLVDVAAHSIHEADLPDAATSANNSSSSARAQNSGSPQQAAKAAPPAENKSNSSAYQPGDDLVYSVPTGRRLDRHGFYINFTHRFPYSTAFTGPARGAILLGLDDVSVSSFGFRFGVTSKLSVAAYRSPSLIARPIELMAAYNFLDEKDNQPFNAAVRFSVDGQNNFSRNFTSNFELIVSRSITHRAQIYLAPTVSIHNRPLIGSNGAVTEPMPFQPCAAPLANGVSPSLNVRPCADTFSLGVAAAVDVRPTVALVAETIPTLVNGTDLGIHRPAYAFGIQKKIWRHAFTFGFSNSPGTTVSQRAGTRATYLGDPTADKPSGLFVGFDLSRQAF
jgi:hypothetical protein